MMIRNLKANDSVEIRSNEAGFHGSWYPGRVLTTPTESVKCEVEYTTLFRDKDGKTRLKEAVELTQLRPPAPLENKRVFVVGDEVDAFYNHGWWEGIVTDVLHDKFTVFLKSSKEQIRFGKDELRFHREWLNGAWKQDNEVKIASCFDIMQELSIGTLVEVSSEEEGFEDSWFPAKLIEYKGNDKCVIEYDQLKAQDGIEILREEVHVSQIRPRPVEMVMLNLFDKLHRVDVLYNDGWWLGVVVKILAKSNYMVHFNKTQEVLKFHHSQLRLHQEWNDGKWVTSSKAQKV